MLSCSFYSFRCTLRILRLFSAAATAESHRSRPDGVRRADCKRHDVFSGPQVRTSRPRCQKLHVSSRNSPNLCSRFSVVVVLHLPASADDVLIKIDRITVVFRYNTLLHCALSLAAQCIVIGPVSLRVCLFVGLFVCGSLTMITRNCVHRSSPNWVCR